MVKILNSILLIVLLCGYHAMGAEKPTVFLIGDSTVKNGQGDGQGGLWGWGSPIAQFFDTTKVNIENRALGGTSSRTYQSLGLWAKVLPLIKPGDFVFIQFGHNDSGSINDTLRARGTIKGTGNETVEIDNLLTSKHEIVHSYGWYLKAYIHEIKAKGAIPVVLSPIPRNQWEEGKVIRNKDNYGGWAKKVAKKEHVAFINLNEKMAEAMETIGEAGIRNIYFFDHDHTHTSAKGAVLAASMVVEGIKESGIKPLTSYLLNRPEINFPVKKRIFLIGDSTVANGNDSIVGWGRELIAFFDTSRIELFNNARGGRSSRSYQYEGLWDEVLAQLSKDDFVLIQFGHNDSGNIDKQKFRGSLPGTGNETQTIVRPDSTQETVHTYGWYLRKYVADAQAKGCHVFILSHIPRNRWKDGKVERVNESYGKWARETAVETGAYFIDLNNTVADQYQKMGNKAVDAFFIADNTHTTEAGARNNAKTLATIILNHKESTLRNYIIRDSLSSF